MSEKVSLEYEFISESWLDGSRLSPNKIMYYYEYDHKFRISKQWLQDNGMWVEEAAE